MFLTPLVSWGKGGWKDSLFAQKQQTPLFSIDVQTFTSTCGYNNGGIAITVSGGRPPYIYKVGNGAFWRRNGLFGNLLAGTHRIYIKDANSLLDSIDVTVANRLAPINLRTAVSNANIFLCDDLYQNFSLVATGGTPPFLYTIDFIHMQSSPVFNNLRLGNYNWAVQDANGCVAMTFSSIGARNCLFAFSGGDTQNNCDSVTTANLQASYWANGSNPPNRCLISANGGPYQFIPSAYGGGLHTFDILDTVTGATTQYFKSVLKYCRLVLRTAVTDATCSGQSGALKLTGHSGTGPYQYSADGINFSALDSFANLEAGFYTYMVKDAEANVAFAVVEVLKSCPSVSANTQAATCGTPNGAIVAIGRGGVAPYLYSIDGANFQNAREFPGLAAGRYTLTIKDAQGYKDSALVNINNGGCITAQLIVSNGDCGGAGSIQVLTTGGQPPLNYSLDSTTFQASNVFGNLSSGQYSVFVKDGRGLIIKSIATVKTKDYPKFNLGNDTAICRGNSIVLTTGVALPGATYRWNTGSSQDSIVVSQGGLYWLNLISAEGCTWTDSLVLSVNNLPVFDLGSDTFICENKNLTLDASISNNNNVQYRWSNNSTSAKITLSSPGLYWCEAELTGCLFRDSVRLTVRKNPVVNFGPDTSICEASQLILNAFNDSSSYLWHDNSTLSTFIARQSGTYSVSVEKDGCIAGDTIFVGMHYKPQFTLGQDRLICLGESIVLAPKIDSSWELRWQDNSHKPYFVVNAEGLVSLSATNACGTMQDEVLFVPGKCQVYIPNAFTPNGDTKNEIFNAVGTESISFFKLLIYDRYGRLVFQSNDKNRGWNGYILSTPADPGNYIYLLTYKDNTGEHQRKGNVLLIR